MELNEAGTSGVQVNLVINLHSGFSKSRETTYGISTESGGIQPNELSLIASQYMVYTFHLTAFVAIFELQ